MVFNFTTAVFAINSAVPPGTACFLVLSLQRPASYQAWSYETPDDFVFEGKGSRYCYFDNEVHTQRRRPPGNLAVRWGLASGLSAKDRFAPGIDATNIELVEAFWKSA